MVAVPTEDYINLVEMIFIDDMLYFKAEDDDNLQSDRFGKLEPTLSIIRNLNDQVLFVDQGKRAVFEDMPDSDIDNATETIFKIYVYKDSQPRGLAVAISVQKHGETYTLSCENKNISFKEISPPDDINETKSDIIFFQRSVPGHDDKIQFESSLYEGYFLASKKENDLYKLTLKKQDDYGDKSVMFTVLNKN